MAAEADVLQAEDCVAPAGRLLERVHRASAVGSEGLQQRGQEGLSVRGVVAALEIHEDAVLVRLAEERISSLAGRRTLTDTEVWG